jgi:hypothetical protein
MPVNYNNLPSSSEGQSQNKFVNAIDAYSETPIELDSATFDAVTGFFTNKNFNKMAAQSVAVIIMSQCKRDNLNPMQVLDTMQGVTSADLSLVLTEILNYNRYNSSFIGYSSINPLQNQEVFRNIVDNDKMNPVYIVFSQKNEIYEGDQAIFNITVKDVKTGTMLYWDLSNSTIESSDVAAGTQPSGQIQVINDGISSIQSYSVPISTILDSNFNEIDKRINLNVRVNSPTSGPVTQGSIKLIPRVPIIRIVPVHGIRITGLNYTRYQWYPWELYETTDLALRRYIFIDAMYVPLGIELFWTLDGNNVNQEDFVTPISGKFKVLTYNQPEYYRVFGDVLIHAKKDSVLEGDEALRFNLRTGSLTGPIIEYSDLTIIDDTSFLLDADYITIEYKFTDGQDLDTRTRVTKFPDYVGWSQLNEINDIIIWSGDNTSSSGSESVLIDLVKFREGYSSETNLTVDCRAQWYGSVGSNPIELFVTAYKGGEMIFNNTTYDWSNPTATEKVEIGKGRVSVNLKSTDPLSLGYRVGVFKYDFESFVGYIDFYDTTIYP